LLAELHENQAGICVGVKDTSSEFLKYLDKQGIALGSKIEIIGKESFDLSLKIKVDMRICPFRIKLPVIFCEGNIVYLAYL
jgi:DtxR family Mn-dependent transcriptional regulator